MIFIALGSNLGDRADYLAQARMALLGFDVDVIEASTILETPALMPEGAPAEWNMPYLNQVVSVATPHKPYHLLTILKLIEQELGRREREHWAPREIDLDLLAYHDEIIITDALVVPHPRLDERAFVLKPIKEIAPDWIHQVLGKTARELLEALKP
jgi:2-amino-4-hydroxy-6-hydroxymethyldihydropteridine diphosphokinase